MFITDYTLNWLNRSVAQLTWEGDSSDMWYSVFIDGELSLRFEDSGSITENVLLDVRENHSIAIVQHDNEDDDVACPEETKQLRPTVNWLRVENVAEYIIYEIDDEGEEYWLHTEKAQDEDPPAVYSWQVPVDLPKEGVEVFRVRVWARGSWGFCETPSIVSGFVAGHPSFADTITAVDESTGNELQITTA